MDLRALEWREVDKNYEISDTGLVRRKKFTPYSVKGRLCVPIKNNAVSPAYYYIFAERPGQKGLFKSKLYIKDYHKYFPELPNPAEDPAWFKTTREFTELHNKSLFVDKKDRAWVKRQKKKWKTARIIPRRQCAGTPGRVCKAKTYNYRCQKCWDRLRTEDDLGATTVYAIRGGQSRFY